MWCFQCEVCFLPVCAVENCYQCEAGDTTKCDMCTTGFVMNSDDTCGGK